MPQLSLDSQSRKASTEASLYTAPCCGAIMAGLSLRAFSTQRLATEFEAMSRLWKPSMYLIWLGEVFHEERLLPLGKGRRAYVAGEEYARLVVIQGEGGRRVHIMARHEDEIRRPIPGAGPCPLLRWAGCACCL